MDRTIGKQIEIVGIQAGTHDRTCCYHQSNCGQALEIGTLLKVRDGTIYIDIKTRVQVKSNNQTSSEPKKRGLPRKDVDQFEVQTVQSVLETKKVYLMCDGIESCCVGFVSLVFQNLYFGLLDGRMLRVQSLSTNSESDSETRRNNEYSGIALAMFVN